MPLESEPQAVTEMPPPALDPNCPACTHPWGEHDGAKCIRGITRNGAPVAPSCRRCRANLNSLATQHVTDEDISHLIDSMFNPHAEVNSILATNPGTEAGTLSFHDMMATRDMPRRDVNMERIIDALCPDLVDDHGGFPVRTSPAMPPRIWGLLPGETFTVSGDPRTGPMYIDGERIDP